MYPFPIGLALIDLIAERPDRRHIHEGRLERAARLAREGRGYSDEPHRTRQPRRRSHFAWLLGTRGRATV